MSQYIIINLTILLYYVTINFTVKVGFTVKAGRKKLL